jgi:hypothetical protein
MDKRHVVTIAVGTLEFRIMYLPDESWRCMTGFYSLGEAHYACIVGKFTIHFTKYWES